MKKKTACGVGNIERIGYVRKGYTRGDGVFVKRSKVAPSCVKDVGKRGKTPKDQTWTPKILKGGLSQYFPNEEMAYDSKSCVIAGGNAKKFGATYRGLSSQFINQRNLRGADRKDASERFEVCRQYALIGFDPDKTPKSSIPLPDTDAARAARLAKSAQKK